VEVLIPLAQQVTRQEVLTFSSGMPKWEEFDTQLGSFRDKFPGNQLYCYWQKTHKRTKNT